MIEWLKENVIILIGMGSSFVAGSGGVLVFHNAKKTAAETDLAEQNATKSMVDAMKTTVDALNGQVQSLRKDTERQENEIKILQANHAKKVTLLDAEIMGLRAEVQRLTVSNKALRDEVHNLTELNERYERSEGGNHGAD